MRHGIIHSIKLFFARIGWFLRSVNDAVKFRRQVQDYRFLMNTKKRLEQRLLSLKRDDETSPEIVKTESQIEIINAILTYGDRR